MEMCNIVHSTLEPINSKIYTDLQKLSKFLNTTPRFGRKIAATSKRCI